MRHAPTALIALLLLTSCASGSSRSATERDAATLERTLAGRVAGPSESCLPPTRALDSQIVGQTLLYRDGRTIWRLDLPDCPAPTSDPIIVTETFGSSLCENDRLRTVPRGGAGIPGPICRVGRFVPYRRPR